jgi:RNA polymerase sigma factor for flagellar operon FliA
MAQLPELQKKVLAMYYYENMQLSEIAAIFGMTESRICQIRGQAVALLRGYLTKLLAGGRGANESSAGKYHTLF